MLPIDSIQKSIFRYSSCRIALLATTAFLLNSCESPGFKQGKTLYTAHCASCHMADGTGLTGIIPPLAGSDYLKADPIQVACIIRYGLADTILVNGKRYSQPMPAMPKLTEPEIANIMNYINHAWNNQLKYVSLQEVQTAIEACAR